MRDTTTSSDSENDSVVVSLALKHVPTPMQGEQNTSLLPRKSYFIFNLEDQFVFYSMSSIESICHAMASSLHGWLPAHQAKKSDSKLPSLKALSCVHS
jgi:hypothetical protein